MKKVLVYGWYYQGNIGDDLFIEAYHQLFPNLDFIFTEKLSTAQLSEVDTVFFGGGSFLVDPPRMIGDVLSLLKKKHIFYLGVGVENKIHTIHQTLMQQARLVAIRTPEQLAKVRQIAPHTILIPDLVYALTNLVPPQTVLPNSVLILPNVAVLPQNGDPHWKYASWNYFKSEFSQFVDYLVENNYLVKFLPMCLASKEDDRWAAIELVSAMRYRENELFLSCNPREAHEVFDTLSQYSSVITQRFHGIVLSEMCRVPYLAIHHHDKLKKSTGNTGHFLSYHGLSKHSLIEAFNSTINTNCDHILPIESNIFKTLVEKVLSLL